MAVALGVLLFGLGLVVTRRAMQPESGERSGPVHGEVGHS
ncbi:hypothetical protein ACVW00_002048 [Marmoricola sp. URHA0025 HA25]